MHPAVYILQKLCTKEFTYALKESNKPLVIEKGTSVIIPIYSVQHDPEHFEDPECFRPERFLGDNANNIRKCTYMPFGQGPRACLGFGL